MGVSFLRVLGLLGVLLVSSCGKKGGEAPGETAVEGPLKVLQVEGKRDEGHVQVRVQVAYENGGKESVDLGVGDFQLMAGTDRVPGMVRPFAERLTAAAAGKGTATFDYWMEDRQLAGPLELRQGTAVVRIKSAAGFPSEQLPAGEMVVLSWLDWSVPTTH